MRAEGARFGIWTGGLLGLAIVAGGCRSSQTASTPAPIVDVNGGPDPAEVNNVLVSGGRTGPAPYVQSAQASGRPRARVLDQRAYAPPPISSGEQYYEQTGPSYSAGQDQPSPAGEGKTGDYVATYEQQVDAGQDALYANQPPPPLPVYEQPELTDPGDQWTPGYWNYAQQGYYWVPGAWIAPPFVGALWTPGYWGASGARYRFHRGFWGHHIGFYGGIPYGGGYTGHGYEGGYWNGDRFFYNRAVTRMNVNRVHNVYTRNVTVVNNDRASYNGSGGWSAHPTASEVEVLHEQRVAPMQAQRARMQEAELNRQQFAAENHGRSALATAERQPADRRAPELIQPAVHSQVAGEQRAARADNLDRGAVRDARPDRSVEQSRQGNLRPSGQVQSEQQRLGQAQPRPLANQGLLQERQEQQRQEQRRLATPLPPARGQSPQTSPRPQAPPLSASRPQFQPAPASRSELQTVPASRAQFQPVPASRPELQTVPASRAQFQPAPAARPELQSQPASRPQFQPAPAARPQLQSQPASRPQFQPQVPAAAPRAPQPNSAGAPRPHF